MPEGIHLIHSNPSLTAKTFHEPINDETFKFLTLKVVGVDDTKLPDMDSFRIGSNCEPGTYVKIQCQRQENGAKSLCGTRGFPDGDLGPYIINGDDAKTGAWPWHVQIFIDEILSCGGSVIKEDWILTAAHCLANASTSDIYIKVGTNFLNDPQSPKIYISHFESHPNFGHFNDIALIKLQSPIKFTKFIRPICLPLQKYNRKKLVSFRHCVLSGFGTTNRTDSTKSKFLQQGRMNILSNNDCGRYLDTVGINYVPTLYSVHKEILDSSNILCGGTIPLESGINVCLGDGGSPLVCRNEDKIWIQVGVATNEFKLKSGENCSCSIFTKVDRFLDFIRGAME